MLKSRKRKHLLTVTFILIGLAASCGAMYIYLLRYFFYNKYNVHAQRAALDRLNAVYHQEFELLSIEFETTEVRIGGQAMSICGHMYLRIAVEDNFMHMYVYMG